MSKNRLLIAVAVVALALVTGMGLFAADSEVNAELSMSEMTVKKLTCGACVANINQALADVAGVESIEVSITTGRSKVFYNSSLVDAEQIARVVTAAGYPATVTRELTSEQYKAVQNEEAGLAELYVARIGDRLLGRDEFEKIVNQKVAAGGFQNQPEMRQQLAGQAWQSVKQRILLLDAADKNQVVVQDGVVELKVAQLSKQIPDFDNYVKNRFGSRDGFVQQTREDMIINKNIQEHVLAGVGSPTERQTRFNAWFKQLLNAPVTIYDANLKQAATPSGGCGSGSGGGCCG